MVFSRKPTPSVKTEVAVQGAYAVWDILTSNYMAIERLTLWENFAHDVDLRLHVGEIRKRAQETVASWEKIARSAAIKGPDAARKGMNTAANPEVFHDERIAVWVLQMLQEDLERLFRAVRTLTTNDAIRRKASREIKRKADYLDGFVKYLNLKGWLNPPPLYPNVPKNTPEQLSCAEAAHLWDHLTFRYDNLDENRAWHDAVHDGDFKLILDTGVGILSRQVKRLEKEILYFGMSLPKTPPKVHGMPEDAQFIDDDTIYRLLLTGIQGAVHLHVKAFIQSTVNDRIRTLFRQLLFSEMGLTNKMILYGKVKGWENPAPQYIP